jgi:hypothetical protein
LTALGGWLRLVFEFDGRAPVTLGGFSALKAIDDEKVPGRPARAARAGRADRKTVPGG